MRPIIIDLSQWALLKGASGVFSSPAAFVLLLAAAFLLPLTVFSVIPRFRGSRMRASLGIGFVLALLVVAMRYLSRVHGYGLMLACGFLVAIWLARHRARRCGEDPDVISNLGVLALIGGVVGARASWVIESVAKGDISHLSFDLAVNITSGGLVFDGGLILAMVLIVGYLRHAKLPIRRFLDILAVSTMVGLAFGRVGCLLNGCCFGGQCDEDFPLAIHWPYAAEPLAYPHEGANPYPQGTSVSMVYQHQVDRGQLAPPKVPIELIEPSFDGRLVLKRPGELQLPTEVEAARHAHSLAVQPAQVYGIVNALVIAGLLALFFRLRTREGQVFALLFVLYPITRVVLEVIRDDNPDMTLTPAQWKCIALAMFGIAMLLALRWLPASCGPTLAARMELAAKAEPSPKRPAPRRRGRK